MDDSAFKRDGHFNRTYSCSSQRDVRYSCGTCGYELNLSSSNRNTASIGSKYGKSIKRDGAESSPSSKVVSHTKYDIRIRALQPSSSEESGIPVYA
ncbi:uncharacterized protein LOC114381087 isoform X2 [Glycine soja]|uniref:uncharacterized protein isoform X2 n=1 Tax=Glycine max TaxID=3847 RepID=UPI000719208D|nr:uncharacterized protein LOC100777814 isoform X2 [Glycine max]XP_028196071.1 uncharacterized protein LOC114381087 isoform X2 [Glycine soja]|eukprot:XP_014620830.1 uncharacterized protein LOC100777814 isoform X2 [Glycine max]